MKILLDINGDFLKSGEKEDYGYRKNSDAHCR